MTDSSTPTRLVGEARIFGFEPSPVSLTVLPRSTSWRVVRAGGYAGGGLALAPVLAVLPPHVVWIIGSIVTGGFLGWRKWSERHTLVEAEGACPKCGGALRLAGRTRLRPAFSLECSECHHDAQIRVARHSDD